MNIPPKLKPIIEAVKADVRSAKEARSQSYLRDKIRSDKLPAGRFSSALRASFGLIAEIKVKSPSAGFMRPENVEEAYRAYENNSLVKAISVLTNRAHFGMSIDRLQDARERFSKPVLRKDFIVDEYQIFEARAFGADAILLMANILDAGKLRRYWQLANSIGLEVLFEAHTPEQIKRIPRQATICGINCRVMDSGVSYTWSRYVFKLLGDRTTDLRRFRMIKKLPHKSIKVAESGISPQTIQDVSEMGYNAALVGTSILMSPEGTTAALRRFSDALRHRAESAEVGDLVPSHA